MGFGGRKIIILYIMNRKIISERFLDMLGMTDIFFVLLYIMGS